jgi:ElaA protein
MDLGQTTTTWSAFDALSGRDVHDLLALRSAIFVVEQRCLYQDVDGLDPLARHLLMRDPDGALVAYARALPPGTRFAVTSIGRVVVRDDHRGTGLGRALMEAVLARLERDDGDVPVKLSAQAHLTRFYASLGFEAVGAPYDEDGIPHVAMLRPARHQRLSR